MENVTQNTVGISWTSIALQGISDVTIFKKQLQLAFFFTSSQYQIFPYCDRTFAVSWNSTGALLRAVLLCENGCMRIHFHLKSAFYGENIWKMFKKLWLLILFVERRVDINIQNTINDTSIHLAATLGRVGIIELLLDKECLLTWQTHTYSATCFSWMW